LTKILFILHYPPPVHGSSLVGGFIKESKLINESFECRYINLGTSASVEEIGKNPVIKLLRYLSLIWHVKWTLLLFRPDLCYLTISSKGIGFYKDSLIVLLVRLFGVKRIYHLHNKGFSTRQRKFFDNLLYKTVFKNANVILLSKYLYPDIQKYVPEHKINYCPNGITDVTSRNSISKNKDSTPKPEILFLSNLIESKGLFILIDALKLIQERGYKFHCTIVGDEGDVSVSQLKDRIKLEGLSVYIEVTGKKYDKEKEFAFSRSDLFAMPTFYHYECMPLVIIEAMHYSLPVVSTFEGAIPDLVEDGVTGFLVPQRDAVALADKLEVLINDSDLRQRMGSAGRARYEAQFTLERLERRMVDILNQVAEKKTDSLR